MTFRVRVNNYYLRDYESLCDAARAAACVTRVRVSMEVRAHTSDQDNEIVIRKSLRTIILRGGFPLWAKNLFDTWSCNKISRNACSGMSKLLKLTLQLRRKSGSNRCIYSTPANWQSIYRYRHL